MRLTIPRIVIGGVTSGVGKTTIAAGLIAALRARGLRVQPFKGGPDYIDPSHLSRAAGRPARNLDSWMLPPDALRTVFGRACQNADVAVIEGMMGLFDGRSGEGETGSTAHLAKLLDAPVLLVIDAGKVARSAAATVLGFQQFDLDLALRGIVLNRTASASHRALIEEPVREVTGLPVLGALPRADSIHIDERHLGLVPSAEAALSDATLRELTQLIEANFDLSAVLALARSAPPLDIDDCPLYPAAPQPPRLRVAVAQDKAFSFYYPENLELLQAWGAEPVPFSPLQDARLPDNVQGLYLGGGFPEVYAAELSANRGMLAAVRDAAAAGMPLLAECGGLMYLCQQLTDFEGRCHPMAQLLPASCTMEPRVMLGYLTVQARRDTLLLPRGEMVRCHEFHHSRLDAAVDSDGALDVVDQPERIEGFARGNLLASYAHVHFAARPDLAPRFVAACDEWARARR